MSEELDVPWPMAIAWLNRCRSAAMRIEPIVREIRALEHARDDVLAWKTRGRGVGRGRGTHSDPTAAEAERRMTELGELIDDKRLELESLQQQVGDGLRLIAAVRLSLGDRHADVIELYYVDCADTWSDVACEMMLTRQRVWQLRSECYAWMETNCREIRG